MSRLGYLQHSEGKNFNCISSSLISREAHEEAKKKLDEINQIAGVFSRLPRFENRLNYISGLNHGGNDFFSPSNG
jgi:hypothetical protein